MATNPVTTIWASGTSNFVSFTTSQIEQGIVYQGNIVSNELNGIEKLVFTSIRHTQTTGELYDNAQTYNPSQYCSQLISTNGITKLLYFQNTSSSDNTGTPPLSGDTSSNQNDVVILSDNQNLTQDSTNWGKVVVDSTLIKTATPTANNMYQLVNLSNKTFGEMKIKTYAPSGNMHCVFDLEIYTLLINDLQFNIKNVLYSSSIRKASTTYSSYANIFFMGFGLVLTSGGLYFGVTNNALCSKIEVEYSKMNFIPTLQQTTLPTPNASTAKIYAIRNGGGTWIQDLGVIKNDYRANGNNSLGETLQFYLFSNGFVQWTSAMTLDINYFHQWSNGNFGSLNIDTSDKYLCNGGTNTGQSLGVIKSQSLPNITASTGNTYELGSNGRPAYAMNMSGEAYSIYGCSMGPGWEGAFYAQQAKPNEIGFQAGLSFWTTLQEQADGNLYQLYLKFDASKSSPVYQSGAEVFGNRVPVFFVVQAF